MDRGSKRGEGGSNKYMACNRVQCFAIIYLCKSRLAHGSLRQVQATVWRQQSSRATHGPPNWYDQDPLDYCYSPLKVLAMVEACHCEARGFDTFSRERPDDIFADKCVAPGGGDAGHAKVCAKVCVRHTRAVQAGSFVGIWRRCRWSSGRGG